MSNYNRGKKFKKNPLDAYIKDKVNVLGNKYPSLKGGPLESIDEISDIVKESILFKGTYEVYTNLDPSRVNGYYLFLMEQLVRIHEQEKLTKLSALTWISEYLDIFNSPSREVNDELDEYESAIEDMLEAVLG